MRFFLVSNADKRYLPNVFWSSMFMIFVKFVSLRLKRSLIGVYTPQSIKKWFSSSTDPSWHSLQYLCSFSVLGLVWRPFSISKVWFEHLNLLIIFRCLKGKSRCFALTKSGLMDLSTSKRGDISFLIAFFNAVMISIGGVFLSKFIFRYFN